MGVIGYEAFAQSDDGTKQQDLIRRTDWDINVDTYDVFLVIFLH